MADQAESSMPGAVMRAARPIDDEYLELPAFLSRQVDAPLTSFAASDRTTLLLSLLAAHQRGEPPPSTIAELASKHGLALELVTALSGIVADTGNDEREVLRVFLALLAEDAVAQGLDRSFRSALRGLVFGSRAHRALRAILKRGVFS
jgi:hypothetical protein